MTYIPKQTKLIRERIEAKLETSLIEELTLYCEYLDSDRDYIVSQALEIAFRRDKGFAEWRKSRPGPETPEAPGSDPEQAQKARARRQPQSDRSAGPSGAGSAL